MPGGSTFNLCEGTLTETRRVDGELQYRCEKCGALIQITKDGVYNINVPTLVTEESVQST